MMPVVLSMKERCRKCLASISLPLVLVISLNVGQQTSGINAVWHYHRLSVIYLLMICHYFASGIAIPQLMFYSTAIFRSAGLSVETSQYASLSLGSINLVMGILALPLFTWFKRRTLLLTSVGFFIPCLFLLTLSMHFMVGRISSRDKVASKVRIDAAFFILMDRTNSRGVPLRPSPSWVCLSWVSAWGWDPYPS